MIFQLESPDGQNRLSISLLRAIAEAAEQLAPPERLFLTGNEKYFSVGADLNAIAALDAPTAHALGREGQHWLNRIASTPVPVIAVVDGYCLGGGLDLALACHARVCTPRTYFGHHGAKLGLVTGWGGTQRLPRLIGRARTLEHLLAAQGWTADQALAEGLVSAIVPSDAVEFG